MPDTVTFVGRPIDPLKGVATLFEALSLLAFAENRRINVWIVGGSAKETTYLGNLFDQFLARAGTPAAIDLFLWGKVENASLPELYSRSSFAVMPSHREPFGLVAVEAMMCGCPVVASGTGGLSETIIHGLTGMLCEVDNAAELAAAMRIYLTNPEIAKRHGKAASWWASREFSQRRCYSKYLEV
jgi:glycosyltransferase involved in cell wall biosynthesis